MYVCRQNNVIVFFLSCILPATDLSERYQEKILLTVIYNPRCCFEFYMTISFKRKFWCLSLNYWILVSDTACSIEITTCICLNCSGVKWNVKPVKRIYFFQRIDDTFPTLKVNPSRLLMTHPHVKQNWLSTRIRIF